MKVLLSVESSIKYFAEALIERNKCEKIEILYEWEGIEGERKEQKEIKINRKGQDRNMDDINELTLR